MHQLAVAASRLFVISCFLNRGSRIGASSNMNLIEDNRNGMINGMIIGDFMSTSKVAVTLEEETVRRVDELVKNGVFVNRSKAVQTALKEKLDRLEGTRLYRECQKLDPASEKAMAEEGMRVEAHSWPEY